MWYSETAFLPQSFITQFSSYHTTYRNAYASTIINISVFLQSFLLHINMNIDTYLFHRYLSLPFLHKIKEYYSYSSHCFFHFLFLRSLSAHKESSGFLSQPHSISLLSNIWNLITAAFCFLIN